MCKQQLGLILVCHLVVKSQDSWAVCICGACLNIAISVIVHLLKHALIAHSISRLHGWEAALWLALLSLHAALHCNDIADAPQNGQDSLCSSRNMQGSKMEPVQVVTGCHAKCTQSICDLKAS